jgi:hypothetical protein
MQPQAIDAGKLFVLKSGLFSPNEMDGGREWS